MDTVGENDIYEAPDGTIEIAGPRGWIRILPEERKKLASMIGIQRHRTVCMFCETPISYGFECGNCHKLAESQQDPIYVFTIWKNNEVVKSGKLPRTRIFQSFNAIVAKNNAKDWDWKDQVFRDDCGNFFALRILGKPEPIEPIQYIVPRIFQDVEQERK